MPPIEGPSDKKKRKRTKKDFPEDVSSLWTTGHVRIHCNNQRRVSIPAERIGNIAVHEAIREANAYSVTAATVGLEICRVEQPEDAILIAEAIWKISQLRTAFSESSKERIRQIVPEWFTHWIAACQKRARYVPIENFIQAQGCKEKQSKSEKEEEE